MRPTLLGSLLDAARHNVARNGPDVAIFESGTVYRATRGRRHAGRRAPRARRAADRRAGWPGVQSWRGERAEADFFAAKALLGALLDKLHVAWSVRPAGDGRSCIPAAAPRCSPAAAERAQARLRGRAAPARRRGVGPGAHGRVRDRPRQARRRGPAGAGLRGRSRRCRRCARTSRSCCPTTSPPREVLERVREAGGEMLDDVSVFDVYTGPQVGEGRRSLALALSFRAPGADAHRRGRRARARARSSRRWASWGVSCVAELHLDARRGRRARAAELRGRLAARARRRRDRLRRRARRAPAVAPPALRAGRRDRALGGRPAPGRPVPALPRAARRSSSSTSTPTASSTRRSSPTRTRPPRRRSATLRERGARVVDLSADFRLSSLATYERWYGEHPRPDLLAAGRLRADRAAPRADRERRDRRQPGLLPDRLAARRSRRSRAPG